MRIQLNSNKQLVEDIRQQIKQNEGHCCCAPKMFWSKDNICMCREFREQMERREEGFCSCGLYQIILDKDEK